MQQFLATNCYILRYSYCFDQTLLAVVLFYSIGSMSRASWKTLQFDKTLSQWQASYLFSQAFYWHDIFTSKVQFLLYTERVHPAVLAIPFAPPTLASLSTAGAGSMRLSFQSLWHRDTFPALILCENAKVIRYLWWSTFHTPAVAACLKQGSDSENNYFYAYIGGANCPTHETVIHKCRFLPYLSWRGLERWGPDLSRCGVSTV